MFMSLVTLCVLSVCIIRRVQRIHNWLSLPFAAWLIIIIYVDSFLFVFVTALFKDIGLNSNQTICEGAILLCLICYMSTKIFIYFFLVEKAVSLGRCAFFLTSGTDSCFVLVHRARKA